MAKGESSTHTRVAAAPRGSVNLTDLRYSISQTRTNFTRVRGHVQSNQLDDGIKPDFITFVSLACEIYRDAEDLVPMQQYPPDLETYQGKGHTSLVSHTVVSKLAASNITRGSKLSSAENVVIKRPRGSILDPNAAALSSFITELRVRTHPPLQTHHGIARLKGIGWDFEDREATIPRPILLEEWAPQGALDSFWKNWSFVRMSFESKLDFCRQIGAGLVALHCHGVVHGDVKPENILVFPLSSVRDSFMVKLTDFGHSVLEQDGLDVLPAFTPLWCAPEAKKEVKMTFLEMASTDCYSYGLVVLSIILGYAFHSHNAFGEVEVCKANGEILQLAIEEVKKEDKENHDSDLDVSTVSALLGSTIQLSPRLRSMMHCLWVIDRRRALNRGGTIAPAYRQQRGVGLARFNVEDKITIGYQTLSWCSHQLKGYIAESLTKIAQNPTDNRRHAAAWELSICHFSGFGVPRSFESCSRWLSKAAEAGVAAAQDYCQNIHDAMGIEVLAEKEVDVSDKESQASDCSPSKPGTQVSPAPIPEEPSVSAAALKEVETPSSWSVASTAWSTPVATNSVRQLQIRGHGVRPPSVPTLFEAVCEAIRDGSAGRVGSLMDENKPFPVNARDGNRNTMLLIAAKARNYEVIDYLLEDLAVNAGEFNNAGLGVLHYAVAFDEAQAKRLVPLLVEAGANPSQEGFPEPYELDFPPFAPGIRACAMLNAILHNKMELLKYLLAAAHSDECQYSCQVCEAGSTFRRILALTLSIFHAEAVGILVEHLRTHAEDQQLNFNDIQVWAGHELLPLSKVPFNSVAVVAMDVPESLFRAMNYGAEHRHSLQRTVDFLLTMAEDHDALAPLMIDILKTAVDRNSCDGVEMLLAEGKQRHFPPIWWIDDPLRAKDCVFTKAINNGSREIFDTLLLDDGTLLKDELDIDCQEDDCSVDEVRSRTRTLVDVILGSQEEEDETFIEHTHDVNLVQLALNAAVFARHQDVYFIDTILRLAKPSLVTTYRCSLLADSILNSNLKAAERLVGFSSELWDRVLIGNVHVFMPGFRMQGSAAQVQTSLGILNPTVVQKVLHEGSYEQCRFALELLLSSRGRAAGLPTSWKAWADRPKAPRQAHGDDGTPAWHLCPLKPSEYRALMAGNILRVREDRQALWDVIGAQANRCGHSRSVTYLRDAIACGNVGAVSALLEHGWSPNVPPWKASLSPLQLIVELLAEKNRKTYSEALLDMMQMTSGPVLLNSNVISTHYEVYHKYWRGVLDNICQLRSLKINVIHAILKDHGARPPRMFHLSVNPKSRVFRAIALVLYVVFYLVLAPLVLVYGTTETWTTMSQAQKFGFMYLWAFLAMLFPPYILLLRGWGRRYRGYFFQSWRHPVILAFLFNHFVLPALVIHVNWQPFQSCSYSIDDGRLAKNCTNYSFLLPLAVGAVEQATYDWILSRLWIFRPYYEEIED